MFDAARPDATCPLASPLHVSWVLTSRCNLACEYCLEDSVPADADDVPEELRDLIAREIVENRVLKVSISGGEPLLVESLPRLIARLREGGVFVRLTTNGVVMDERCQMDELQDDRGRNGLLAAHVPTGHLRGKQQKSRSELLSLSGEDVVRDLVNEASPIRKDAAQFLVNERQLLGHWRSEGCHAGCDIAQVQKRSRRPHSPPSIPLAAIAFKPAAEP